MQSGRKLLGYKNAKNGIFLTKKTLTNLENADIG